MQEIILDKDKVLAEAPTVEGIGLGCEAATTSASSVISKFSRSPGSNTVHCELYSRGDSSFGGRGEKLCHTWPSEVHLQYVQVIMGDNSFHILPSKGGTTLEDRREVG